MNVNIFPEIGIFVCFYYEFSETRISFDILALFYSIQKMMVMTESIIASFGRAENDAGAACRECFAVPLQISGDAAENAAAVLRRRYRSAVMLLRRAPMAFFSSRDTCACEMPTSPEISVCVLPSK